MSAPVRTISPASSLAEARSILTRYGHTALPVIDGASKLVGIISRRDIDIALHHGFEQSPVSEHMTAEVWSVSPEAAFAAVEALMVNYDIGRVPVVGEEGQVLGIITRTDILRHHYQLRAGEGLDWGDLQALLKTQLPPLIFERMVQAAHVAESLNIAVYLVGGAVRDLLLDLPTIDIDLVVEGTVTAGAVGIELATALYGHYPEARLECFAKYQTASLAWPDGFALDFATARTEFYPRPGANPEVEASSLRLDLYRRDFTINALAIGLNGVRAWQLVDYFGGAIDLKGQLVRVLHPNSFIEDPTRIFRAVRFAVRLGFSIAPQTETFIVRSLKSGIHDGYGGDRLKTELQYLLSAPYWQVALETLAGLDALRCLDASLRWSEELASSLRWLSEAAPRLDVNLSPGELRLERLLLAATESADVRLPLDGQTLARLKRVRAQHGLLELAMSPAALHKLLPRLDTAEWLLHAALGDSDLRRAIIRYLEQRREAPLISGHDLAALGFKPGPRFKEILEQVLLEQLAGTLTSREQALAWVQEHFPS